MMLKNKLFAYILFAINALIFSGCDLANPPEDIPAYIHIKDYTLTTDPIKEGTSANKITDAWLYVGNSFLGAFELPTTVPSLEKGMKEAIIMAGVKENGISTTHVPYPFYQSYKTIIDLKETKVDTIKPVWKYKEETRFPWIEDFEGSAISIENNTLVGSTTDFRVTTSTDSAFEGNSALAATLDKNHTYFECITKNAYQMPRGKAVWLELNYKTEVPVEVGVQSIGAAGNAHLFVAGMKPSANWNKIYINLTTTVSYEPQTQVFRIYIAAFNEGNGGRILIDNIKLLNLE
ncbi:MAG: hypothetical protein EOP53_02175 [Sphingobacteriales bacterium]|nr:MAG: hypothetical protein EOP53_02175 [Sphingobacteriales bacterium]